MRTQPIVIDSADDMRRLSQTWQSDRAHIGLVPTMGFLHEGHLSLVHEARRRCDKVVVSIFVNPLQFGPNEDLERYPRSFARDLELLTKAGVDAVFAPTREALYGPQFDTHVVPKRRAAGLCGASRPNFFEGVCTVVMLLFRITLCRSAFFGEKDYQQLQIIRGMSRDLWLDVDIIGMPLVRESDGLAQSSRNAYLKTADRPQALALWRGLQAVKNAFDAGERSVTALKHAAKRELADQRGWTLDYLDIVDAQSLEPLSTTVETPAVCAVAGWLNDIRLIDNQPLNPASSGGSPSNAASISSAG